MQTSLEDRFRNILQNGRGGFGRQSTYVDPCRNFCNFLFNTEWSTSSWVKDWHTHHDAVQRVSRTTVWWTIGRYRSIWHASKLAERCRLWLWHRLSFRSSVHLPKSSICTSRADLTFAVRISSQNRANLDTLFTLLMLYPIIVDAQTCKAIASGLEVLHACVLLEILFNGVPMEYWDCDNYLYYRWPRFDFVCRVRSN